MNLQGQFSMEYEPPRSIEYGIWVVTLTGSNAIIVKNVFRNLTGNLTHLDPLLMSPYPGFTTETLSFGNSGSVDNVAIKCGCINQGNFGGFVGILGFEGNVIALPSQIKVTSFSYCLVNIDSSLSSTLEFNLSPLGHLVLVSFVTNPSFNVYYYAELTGITVSEDQISIPASIFQIGNNGNGGIILDSGTTVT
ncbi:hypothetical protein ACH5RR_024991 [Cinchona calisaya]|uniref:Peptidase A1 domain-containing protein n=1 Tax=Cinchona calisaya TaxID=153742 RepID=A0ABD2Z0X7_9GENT